MLKDDLVAFAIKSLSEIDPISQYSHNWHIELICEYLKKVYTGEIKRLIINIPPRSLKSVCVSVAFPAWIMSTNPKEKIICVSYSQELCVKHSTDCRKIMQSKWYQDMTKTRIKKGESQKRKFSTEENGYRFATSVGGTLTGEGGNIIIVDDPQNPMKIFNKKERSRVNQWFSSVLSSRLNNKKTGKIIIVMQRLHAEDLTGYLTSAKMSRWKVLSIPELEDENLRIYSINGKIYKFRSSGDILNPGVASRDEVESIKKDVGSFVFSAQYQQNPMLEVGIIKTAWFGEFADMADLKFDDIMYSIDTAVSQKEANDYSVIMKIGICNGLFYVLDVKRQKCDYITLKNILDEIVKIEPNVKIVIEDKNIGSSLIQEMRKKFKNAFIVGVNPTKDKLTRLISVIGLLESKRVILPSNASWRDEFLLEASMFPNVAHDDQVDALVQGLQYFLSVNEKTKKTPGIRMI